MLSGSAHSTSRRPIRRDVEISTIATPPACASGVSRGVPPAVAAASFQSKKEVPLVAPMPPVLGNPFLRAGVRRGSQSCQCNRPLVYRYSFASFLPEYQLSEWAIYFGWSDANDSGNRVRLLLQPCIDHQRFAKVGLRFARGVKQGYKHLPAANLFAAHNFP